MSTTHPNPKDFPHTRDGDAAFRAAVRTHTAAHRERLRQYGDPRERLRQYGNPRHTYTEGRHHRDTKGRFASTALAGTSLAAMSAGTVAGLSAKGAHDVGHAMPELRTEAKAARNKYTLAALGLTGVAGAAMAGHAHANRSVGEVEKFLDGTKRKVKHGFEHLRVSPDQARNAGVLGQIGAGAGVVAGSAVGAGIGIGTKHPGQGAGIGAAIGGALGGAGGAAAGLAAGNAPKKKKPKLVGAAPQTVSKSAKRDAAIGAGAGLAAGQVIGAGARSASDRVALQALTATHRGKFNQLAGTARHLERTADFHQGAKGVAVMAGLGATAGLVHHKRAQKKVALAPATPVVKMDDDKKTQLARAGIIGAQVADIAAIKSAAHETFTAKKEGTGLKASLSYGAKKAALPVVAGGLVATVAAERVMHNQQKKLRAQTAAPAPAKLNQPSTTQVARVKRSAA